MVEIAWHQKYVYVLLDGLVVTAHKVQSIFCMHSSKHVGIKQKLKKIVFIQYTVDGEYALNAIRYVLIICIIIKCYGKYTHHITV